jgi:ankyrin repeat protein
MLTVTSRTYFPTWAPQNDESSRQSDLQREDGNGLHTTVRKGNLTMVQALLQENGSVVSFDSDGWTPLHVAAARGRIEILQALLQMDVDIDVLGEGGYKYVPLS